MSDDEKIRGWPLVVLWLAISVFSAACWYGVFKLVVGVLS